MSAGLPAATDGRLDVVVVNFETPGLLNDCLHSITGQTTPGLGEVIVVDNSITAEGAELVVRNHSTARLLRSASNVGYGSAANLGIAAGAAEFVLVLNADAQLHAGTAQALIEELDAHPDTGVVGPRLVDSQGRIQPSCARFPTPGRVLLHEAGLWKLIRWTRLRSRTQPFFELDVPGEVPWVLGAALAIRRQSFDIVGGFDPEYFMYYEEVDLCRRLAAIGSTTRFTPAATIGHIGGASTELNRAPMQREMFRSLARYTRSHGRDPGLIRLRLAVVAVALVRSGHALLTHRRRPRSGQSAGQWRAIVGDALRGWRNE